MRRLIVALTITLSTLVACAPAVAAQPQPQPTVTTTRTTDPCRPLDKACWQAHIARRHNEAIWWAEVRKQQDYARLVAYAAAVAASHQCRGYGCVQGIRVCGGDLPTCPIVWRESRFDPHAENPTSTASGLYQFIDGTFATCRTGYRHASSAPVSVQVACARQIWNHGRGASHWRL